MSRVESIETQIRQLSSAEFAELRSRLFFDFHYASEKQVEMDPFTYPSVGQVQLLEPDQQITNMTYSNGPIVIRSV